MWNQMKDQIYQNYISTHFGRINKGDLREYTIFNQYFDKNYTRFMPKDTGARILEIGCGMGHFLYYMEKHGYVNYLGIDISRENIEFCKEKKFKVEQNDVFEFLRSNKEPFDAIIINDVLEHFKKEEIFTLLGLIYENLTVKGTIIAKVPNSANPILGNSSRYLDFTHETSFTEESMSQILNVIGFKEVRIHPQNIYIFYTNPLNYLAKALAWTSFKLFRILFLLYGRKSTKIFTKDIIAVGIKP